MPLTAWAPDSVAVISAEPLSRSLITALHPLSSDIAHYPDTDAFLVSREPYGHSFYVVSTRQTLAEATSFVRLLRRRTNAGLVAWRTRAPCAAWLDAGADLWLGRGATEADLASAVRAVRRRLGGAAPADIGPWRLGVDDACLWTPDGAAVSLSQGDLRLLSAFAGMTDASVTSDALKGQLGTADAQADNWLHAAIYRVRRRVERATGAALPLAAVPGTGYVFRGRLDAL